MSRSYLVLTTLPPPGFSDPSERNAVLAARREAALEAWVPERTDPPGAAITGSAGPPAAGRAWFGWVDALGRTHHWPGLLRERGMR